MPDIHGGGRHRDDEQDRWHAYARSSALGRDRVEAGRILSVGTIADLLAFAGRQIGARARRAVARNEEKS